VFDTRTPPTGVRLIPLGAAALGLGKLAVPAGAALTAAITTRTGRKLAGGATKPQQLARLMALRARQYTPTVPLTAAATAGSAGLREPFED
jgi:hypothetical protein